MTPKHVEEKLIELKHRQPFVPFVVEFTNGESLVVPDGRLSINGSGACYIGPAGGLVDF